MEFLPVSSEADGLAMSGGEQRWHKIKFCPLITVRAAKALFRVWTDRCLKLEVQLQYSSLRRWNDKSTLRKQKHTQSNILQLCLILNEVERDTSLAPPLHYKESRNGSIICLFTSKKNSTVTKTQYLVKNFKNPMASSFLQQENSILFASLRNTKALLF